MIRITIAVTEEQKAAVESFRAESNADATATAPVAVATACDEYDLVADDGTRPVGVIRVGERRAERALVLADPVLLPDLSYEQSYNARTGLLRLALHRAGRSGLRRVFGGGYPVEQADGQFARTLQDVEDLFGTFQGTPTFAFFAGQDQFALSKQAAVDEYILLAHGDAYTFDSGTCEVVRGEIEERTPEAGFEPFRKRVIHGTGERLAPGTYLARGQCELIRMDYDNAFDAACPKAAVPSIGLAAVHSYVLAHVACSLEDVGWYDYVSRPKRDGLSFTATCEELKVRRELFRHMLRYFEIAGIVHFDSKNADLYTCDHPALERLRHELGYLLFMVRGYTPVLSEMTALVRGEKRYFHDVRRNDDGVQRFFQSYAIDVQPELDRVLDRLPTRHVAHIGCGAANRLITLCAANRHLLGTGIEIDAAACEAARANVERAGLSDRITIVHRDIYQWVKEPHHDVDLVLLVAGMFHDFHNRPQGATPLLKSLRACIAPTGYLVVEDQNLQGAVEPAFPLSVAEGFEFVHTLVGARLFTREQYTDLFTGAGWSLEQVRGNQLACDWIYVLRAS